MPENSSCSSASTCSRESCEGCPSKAKGGSGIAKEPMNKASNVKKVIGVVSGKGGVGKSLQDRPFRKCSEYMDRFTVQRMAWFQWLQRMGSRSCPSIYC